MSSGSRGDQSRMMGLASQFGFATPMGSSSPKWSYEEVIKSRTMAKSLLKHRFDTKKYGSDKELLQILTYGDKEPEILNSVWLCRKNLSSRFLHPIRYYF